MAHVDQKNCQKLQNLCRFSLLIISTRVMMGITYSTLGMKIIIVLFVKIYNILTLQGCRADFACQDLFSYLCSWVICYSTFTSKSWPYLTEIFHFKLNELVPPLMMYKKLMRESLIPPLPSFFNIYLKKCSFLSG